ncbi:MAG: M20/M25/M40 family metallo-hydrolase [Gemmatimonadota bacterium]|nr:MAG: M20/M25/M40 family metallo-hydrolase [Gemmatimonadota bacterium]
MKTKAFRAGICLLLTVMLFCSDRPCCAKTEDLLMISLSALTREQIQFVEGECVSYGHIDDQTIVALTKEEELAAYQNEGLAYEILGDFADGSRFFLVSFVSFEQRDKLDEIGQVVFIQGDRALLRVEAHWDRTLPKYGIELVKAFFVPKQAVHQKRLPVSRSPLLSDIVHEVSPVRIYNFILDLQNFQTRFAYAEECSLAANYLIEQFESWGLEVTEHWFFNSAWISYQDPQRNIIATLPGTTYPDEIVAICAHYDSYSEEDPWNYAPGADDNASGTAAVLETARILSQYGSERTLQFICFGGEEQWMIGSYAYVEERRAAGDNFVAVINNDMIAYTGEGKFEDIEVDCIPETEWMADDVMALASDFVTYPMTKNVDWGNVSDHTPFWENGYPAIELAEDEANEVWGGTSPYYHTPGDVIETLNFEFATQIVKMNAAALASWADVSVTGSAVACGEHMIDDDDLGESQGNGNGYVDPGETIELVVFLNNIGVSNVSGVSGTLQTDDEYVTLIRSTVAFGDIGAGGSIPGQDPFTFTVSQNCPNGHQILFSLTIEDDQARVWEGGLVVEVLQPIFVFHSHSFEEVGGNGDSVLDPGETANLYVFLENIGFRGASGITAHLETDDPDVSIADGEAVFPDIAVGEHSGNTAAPFTFSVQETASLHTILFTVHVSEGMGCSHADVTVRLLIGQGTVLLIPDDGGIGNENYYIDAFRYLGVPYEIGDVQGVPKPVSDGLLDYSEVIWFTGAGERNTLMPEDQSSLESFLNEGGKLLLSGSMIGYDVGNTSFYRSYLHGHYVSFMTMLHHLNGAPSNPVVGEMDIALSSTGNNAQSFAGEIDAIPPAVSIFEYDRATEEGSGVIRSSGSGALAVETSVYKVAYFSFGIEGIEPVEDRAQVLADVLLWFKAPGIDKGDVDGNGTIDIIDAVVGVNIVIGLHQPSEEEIARADMNYDGEVNIVDVVKIVNAVLGSSGKAMGVRVTKNEIR